MKVNLAFPLRQADVTGFQSDTASENGGRNIHEWEMHWNFILLKKKKKGGMLWKMMFLWIHKKVSGTEYTTLMPQWQPKQT